jgi:O-acetyl-ADP-ribose deacetylase
VAAATPGGLRGDQAEGGDGSVQGIASVWSGLVPLGGAVQTLAGRLPYRSIIHVAGINLLWRASERSIRDSVRNAVQLAVEHGDRSVAFPLIEAGSGGFDPERATQIMLDELGSIDAPLEVILVLFKKEPLPLA